MADKAKDEAVVDTSLKNPDVLTKYKTAGTISQKVLEAVTALCVEGAKIVEICQKGDALLAEEVGRVYKGKKMSKGVGHACTVSPSSYITPYTPLVSDAEEAETSLRAGEVVKIQLGAQLDGFCAIVCDTIVVAPGAGGAAAEQGDEAVSESRRADLMLAAHYANELLLRLMVPPGLLAAGTDEERQKAAAVKPPSQAQISQLIEKAVKSFECSVVESTTSWQFEHNDIEGKKKLILAPVDGQRGDGAAEVGEVWGVEVGVSLGSGKGKRLDRRATLHRRTGLTYQLKRPSSRTLLTEIVHEFKTFPFSLRQCKDERGAKVGVVECVRSGVLRAYEVEGDKDDKPVARLLSTVALTKNGLTVLAAAPKPDLSKYKTDNKITDPEILQILERPLARNVGKSSKNKKKKKKPAKKAAAAATPGEAEEDDDDDDDDDDEE